MLIVRKKPAIRYQPPFASGGNRSPYSGDGGSSASHGSWRTNSIGLQPTDFIMLRPMISKAMKPHISEVRPQKPR
jgi:hypothetical protein